MSLKGIINIDKPQDYTSFDCVAILRGAARTKKIGHTGTLDPMATGVLACCIGPATRILEYLEDDIKEYSCTLKLGLKTDTCDIWGNVTAIRDFQDLQAADEAKIREVFAGFGGEIEQVPPQYAAIKVGGRKLYEYARAGQAVDVPARRVTVHELEILDIREDEIDFRVVCSKGFYVRSLCRDIGEKLATGGTMAALRRTRTGMCTIADSLPIEAVKEMNAEELAKYVIPMDRALAAYPRADFGRKEGIDFLNGKLLKNVPAPDYEEGTEDSGDGTVRAARKAPSRPYVRVYGEERFLGMAVYDAAAKTLKPHKVLSPEIREEWAR